MLQYLKLTPQDLLVVVLKVQSRCLAMCQVHSHLITMGSSAHSHMVVWNSLIRLYSIGPFPAEALMLYKSLRDLTFPLSPSPFDSFTYSFLLKACTNVGSVVAGSQYHALSMKAGFAFHVYVQTALVNMYAFCGSLLQARKVFSEMSDKNSVTWNALITGLTKWGKVDAARSLFDEMPDRTVVSWTGMIDGYTRMNQPKEAMALFRGMIAQEGVDPSEITLLAIFPAISALGDIRQCQVIHSHAEKRGFVHYDIRVVNSMIDVYGKCGCVESAGKAFHELSSTRRNLVSWTSIISVFATHGMASEALDLFRKMEAENLKPNQITFLSILNACSHGGLVEEAMGFFTKMIEEYRLQPDIKHYGCVIDMLGRAGRLKEAESIALGIPKEMESVVIWRTLLGACSLHDDAEMGQRVTERVFHMESTYSGDYVLLSNIYSATGRFRDAERTRNLMDENRVFKAPGQSVL
uniref:Pentatricopeptide repeat-containing protein n=1 Tax=Kalanchoe fedtschenkoi TaxID=63787 RepID=A0A7N0RFN4_KALFE